MQQLSLENMFQDYLDTDGLFKNRRVLNETVPDDILHRDQKIVECASILSPALKGRKPSNLFIYGKPGTGKTTVMKFVLSEMGKMGEGKNVHVVYLNCKLKKSADTEYRVMASLCKKFGRDVPDTGLPTVRIYEEFFDVMEEIGGTTVVVLDEVDSLVSKIGDDFLYNLTRINEELDNAQVSIVGVSNDLAFTRNMDPRVKSSLSEEEILFPPYDADQLKDILSERAGRAFQEGALEDGVVEKCAALAAQEHGDARRALDLLRVAGEIAERDTQEMVALDHVDRAQGKIDEEQVMEAIRTQPRQSQAVLWTILQNGNTNTGDVYESYESVCEGNGLKPLTQRRVSDLISELDELGIIETNVVSRGRHGRTRVIELSIGDDLRRRAEELLTTEFYFE